MCKLQRRLTVTLILNVIKKTFLQQNLLIYCINRRGRFVCCDYSSNRSFLLHITNFDIMTLHVEA